MSPKTIPEPDILHPEPLTEASLSLLLQASLFDSLVEVLMGMCYRQVASARLRARWDPG